MFKNRVMKKDIYSFTMFLFVLFFFTGSASPQAGKIKQTKLTRFELQSSVLISAQGAEISTVQYKSKVYWFPVSIPSTVLTGLVANKIYPDPYSGLNNMLIPDASDEFNKKYNLEQFSYLPNNPNPWKRPYWYRTTFNVPASDQGRYFQVIFKGINYRASVWLNGKQIADSTEMAGMFAEYSLDISKEIKAGSDNVLAVKIYPLDYPGLPATEQLRALGDFFENGGPTGDIGKNVTMLCSIGWDWIPPVRDRNMGIWLPVYLRTSGGVTIADPKIITSFPDLPDTTKAKISLNLRLANHNSIDENGKLTVIITPENFKGKPLEFSKNVSLSKNSPAIIDLNGDNTKELNIQNPVLWWPNGYGKPNLYRIRLQYSDNTGISDDTSFVFGIRTVSTEAVNVNGFYRRDFYVNERRVHLTGGAWVPDMMLNRDSMRYDYEMHLCRNSNINLVRIWGGGVTPCDEFFEAADRYGLLVWSDFWITGDTQGEFKGSPDWPLEGNIFIKNVKSTILRIRNHPSLLVWTGGNEGHARKELYEYMRESIIALDGTRPFIPSSSGYAKLPSGWNGAWPDNLPSGVYSGGPYTWQDPKIYYSKAAAGRDWVFKDETGIPSQPPYNIMSKIITNLTWDNKLPFPLNNSWGYHDACTGNGGYDLYYKEMVKRFGEASSMEDFCNKMQLMNAVGYQGIFEAAGSKLNDIGGVMLWKVNSAFPSVVWQVYDWFLMPNAGYYFMQNACEPVHIQLNPIDLKVSAINRTYKKSFGLTATTDIFGMDFKSIFHEEKTVDLAETDVKETNSLSAVLSTANGVNFVVLNLKNNSGKVISHNFYWISKGDYKSFNDMPSTRVDAKVLSAIKGKSETSWTIKIENKTDKLAFFIRPQLISGDEEVLPSYWTANYISLAPSESASITVSCPNARLSGKETSIRISGWNVTLQNLKIN
jgi:Exo-beta-D-glucosaminidase Ig-fold domain/Glycosyl hydrolases family 2/Glycosyl hydrolases family 2, sugar binding domain/Glycosyl hydrolases family 2, TIM barrel domain